MLYEERKKTEIALKIIIVHFIKLDSFYFCTSLYLFKMSAMGLSISSSNLSPPG